MSSVTAARSTSRVRPADVAAIAGGLAVLGIGMLIVRGGTVPHWEEETFRAINGVSDSLYPVLWPFQQLGALLAGPVVAIILLILRRPRAALAAVVATGGKLASERLVKVLVSRERPATSIGPDIEARGDVSVRGESFVSGHAVLVAALAAVVTPLLPRRWRWVPWLVVAIVMFARIYVGAHNPLDVVCGAALGVTLGASATLLSSWILPRTSS